MTMVVCECGVDAFSGSPCPDCGRLVGPMAEGVPQNLEQVLVDSCYDCPLGDVQYENCNHPKAMERQTDNWGSEKVPDDCPLLTCSLLLEAVPF